VLLLGTTRFEQQALVYRLVSSGLPKSAPLSVLAVELVPESYTDRFSDPLGAAPGQVRIPRTSPLQRVPDIC
jgi:hypothetical protein